MLEEIFVITQNTSFQDITHVKFNQKILLEFVLMIELMINKFFGTIKRNNAGLNSFRLLFISNLRLVYLIRQNNYFLLRRVKKKFFFKCNFFLVGVKKLKKIFLIDRKKIKKF